MKATGIVRRIDDLGRVVIPKEIRRTMRIREGDPLEIYTDREGEVIFKKYSPIGELAVFAVQYAETLHKTCQLAIVICDRDAVVASAGVPKKDYGDRKISAEFEDLIEKRSFFASKDSSEKICITEGADTFVSCAMPIIAEGDIAGRGRFGNIRPRSESMCRGHRGKTDTDRGAVSRKAARKLNNSGIRYRSSPHKGGLLRRFAGYTAVRRGLFCGIGHAAARPPHDDLISRIFKKRLNLRVSGGII